MAISAAKRKSCQINGKKSRGPKTTASRRAVRYNAVKHGGAAKTPVLPWEDSAAFAELVVGYKNAIQPVGEIENTLAENAAFACWQRARGVRSAVSRATFNIHTARANEQREAEAAAAASGQRLFFEQHGPLALHPRPDSAAFGGRTVWSGIPDDPDHPSRLVMDLEATFIGVRWLMARWRELRSRIEVGECWHAPEKLKAVRLLGKLSYDAADDRNVAEIYLCSHVLDPQQQDDPFFELRYDMEAGDYKRLRDRLVRRNVESMRPSDPVTARLNLLALVDRRIDRLTMLSDQRLAFDDAMNALRTDIMGFDDSVEGERLRRHIEASDRAMHRAIATIIKMRKDLATPQFDPTECGTDEGAIASAESGIENAESKVEALRDEFQTPAPTTTQTNDDDPTLQNGCDEIVCVSDLQNKPTDAGDEPQVQSAAEVQEPENAARQRRRFRSATQSSGCDSRARSADGIHWRRSRATRPRRAHRGGRAGLPVSNRSRPRVRRSHQSRTTRPTTRSFRTDAPATCPSAICKTNPRTPAMSHKSNRQPTFRSQKTPPATLEISPRKTKQRRRFACKNATTRPRAPASSFPAGCTVSSCASYVVENSSRIKRTGSLDRIVVPAAPAVCGTRKSSVSRRGRSSYPVTFRSWRRFRRRTFRGFSPRSKVSSNKRSSKQKRVKGA